MSTALANVYRRITGVSKEEPLKFSQMVLSDGYSDRAKELVDIFQKNGYEIGFPLPSVPGDVLTRTFNGEKYKEHLDGYQQKYKSINTIIINSHKDEKTETFEFRSYICKLNKNGKVFKELDKTSIIKLQKPVIVKPKVASTEYNEKFVKRIPMKTHND